MLLDIALKYLYKHTLVHLLSTWLDISSNKFIQLESPTIQPTEQMHAKMQFRSFDCCKWPNIKKGTGKKSQQAHWTTSNHSKYPQCIYFSVLLLFPFFIRSVSFVCLISHLFLLFRITAVQMENDCNRPNNVSLSLKNTQISALGMIISIPFLKFSSMKAIKYLTNFIQYPILVEKSFLSM